MLLCVVLRWIAQALATDARPLLRPTQLRRVGFLSWVGAALLAQREREEELRRAEMHQAPLSSLRRAVQHVRTN